MGKIKSAINDYQKNFLANVTLGPPRQLASSIAILPAVIAVLTWQLWPYALSGAISDKYIGTASLLISVIIFIALSILLFKATKYYQNK